MNQINTEKWSPEWYELATTDELSIVIKEVQHLLETSTGMSHTQRSVWTDRIRRVSDELIQRETSGDDWEEPRN